MGEADDLRAFIFTNVRTASKPLTEEECRKAWGLLTTPDPEFGKCRCRAGAPWPWCPRHGWK
jgi:hypothetical protein